MWEAGEVQPQPKHLRRLASLTGRDVSWFYAASEEAA